MTRKTNAAMFALMILVSSTCLSTRGRIILDDEYAYLQTRIESSKISRSFNIKDEENQAKLEIYRTLVDVPFRGVIRHAAIHALGFTEAEADRFYEILSTMHSKAE